MGLEAGDIVAREGLAILVKPLLSFANKFPWTFLFWVHTIPPLSAGDLNKLENLMVKLNFY